MMIEEKVKGMTKEQIVQKLQKFQIQFAGGNSDAKLFQVTGLARNEAIEVVEEMIGQCAAEMSEESKRGNYQEPIPVTPKRLTEEIKNEQQTPLKDNSSQENFSVKGQNEVKMKIEAEVIGQKLKIQMKNNGQDLKA